MTENNENKQDWLDLLRIAREDVEYSAEDIRGIAYALNRVGMDKIYGELLDISYTLDKVESFIGKATSLKTSSDVKDAWNMTGAVLNAAIAGSELEKRKTVKVK